MSSMFPSGRPFSPSGSSVPHHVRRTSGSAGGSSFLAENLGFTRNLSANTSTSSSQSSSSSPPSSGLNASQSRSPQQAQRPPSASSFKEQQQQLAMAQLSFKLEASQLSNPSSSATSLTSSTVSTPTSHRSSFPPLSQLAHAQQSLSSLKRSSLPPTSSSSFHHSPQPPYPHTPSTLSTSTPTSGPTPPVSHLKIKRKIRKNTREKQRRSELNDKFDELQALLQLGGGQTKVEKFAILSEAIGVIEQLKKDVAELRQEKVDTRAEVRKMTGVLEGFWPQNPEMAREFAGRFFPRLSGVLSPHNSVGGAASVYGSGDTAAAYQSGAYLSGTGGGGGHLSGGQFHSGASSASAAPSHSSHPSLMSPSNFLSFQQQQAASGGQQPLPPPSVPYGGQAGGPVKPPTHRRGNSRNGTGSTSSVNLQPLYSSASSIPGLGMGGMFPPPTPPTMGSNPALNGFAHHRKPSLPMPPPVRIPSLGLKSEDKLLYGSQQSQQSMSISPTSQAPNAFSFHSTAQTPTLSSLSSSLSSAGHRKQSSQDYKYSLSSLTSLQSPTPPASQQPTFSHQRSFSGQNSFNVNFNVTIPPTGDDQSAVPSFDSPAVGMFNSGGGGFTSGAGGGGGGLHGHHVSTGSLGGWVGGLGVGLGDGQGMDDVGGGGDGFR